MGLIGINDLIFLQTTSKMSIAGNAIDSTITSLKSQGEKSVALSGFASDYHILQNIIFEYKKLVLKDIYTINKIGTELISVDDRLFRMWSKSNGS